MFFEIKCQWPRRRASQNQAWAIQADRYLFNGKMGTVMVILLLNGNGWVWKMAVILLLEPRSFTVSLFTIYRHKQESNSNYQGWLPFIRQ